MSAENTSFAQALNAALDDAMADDDNVIMLGEDVGDEQGGGVFKVISSPLQWTNWSTTLPSCGSCPGGRRTFR